MEATKQTLASIFNGHRIFNVPFYQRSYVWQKDEWTRFLEDMEFVTKQNKDYFLGSAILKQQSTNMGEANDHRTIIDGQQRFTTLAIFTKVLCMKPRYRGVAEQPQLRGVREMRSNTGFASRFF